MHKTQRERDGNKKRVIGTERNREPKSERMRDKEIEILSGRVS